MRFSRQQLISRGYWAPADDGADAGAGAGGAAAAAAEAADTPPVDRGDNVTSPLDTAGKGDKLDPDGKPEPAKDEGVETDEEKAERERLEAEAEKKKRIRIPKERFDEAIGKAKQREQALLEEIEKLKGGQQASAAAKAVKDMRSEIEKLQDKYEDLILDGKKDEARNVRRQVDAMREELTEYQTSTKSEAARLAAIEDMTYNAQLAGYEAKYPALNPEHEGFDEAKTDEVATLLNAFVKAGQKRSEALARAVKYALGAPHAAPTKDVVDQRAAEARKRAAEANKQQPPDGKSVGLDSDKAGGSKGGDVDIMRLSQDKFAKLDEEMKAKLRGDII
jgi:DNA repair exonuclease SbcCD ATPase subunit